jgi:Holliday junction resolvasome RuvABC endonuclease subunit
MSKIRIISLDISMKSTGWCYFVAGKVKSTGVITTDLKAEQPQRLSEFRARLSSLFIDKKPTHVVIENNFAKTNIKVLKKLSHFAGVANECSQTILAVTPYTMNNTTSKSFFKVKTKEELFEVIVDFFELPDNWEYKACNDMTDAIAQAACYYDKLLKSKVRIEKSYGYLFKVKEE